ncbi:MAG TPA: hypothetical protein V6C81_24580 [Planktothrix sp.]
MTGIRNQFFTSTLLAVAALTSIPSAVFAYNGWTMQSDQRDINSLVQEGVINPMQAQALDNRTVTRNYGGGFFGNMFGGGNGSLFNSGIQSVGQIHREDRQIEKLERDGIISRGQEHGMEKQLWRERDAAVNGMMPGAGYASVPVGYATVPVGYAPPVMAAPSMLGSVVSGVPVVAPQYVEPIANSGMCHHAAWMASHGLLNNAVNNYNPGYYTTNTSGTILNRLGSNWH